MAREIRMTAMRTKTNIRLFILRPTKRILEMMQNARFTIRTGIIIAVSLCAMGAAFASPLSSLTRKGNEAFAEGKFDEALQFYKNAQVESPEAPQLHFNMADVLMRQKKYDEAIQEYSKAIENAKDPAFESLAHYNIGVAQFRQAEQQETAGKIGEALKKLEDSMESNRIAMRKSPSDEDPKYNFEQAKRKWKELYSKYKQQQEQQQQQSSEQQQRQQQQSDQQKAESGEKEKQQQKQEQQQAEQEQEAEKAEQQKAEQKQLAQAQQEQSAGEKQAQEQSQAQQQQQQKPGEMSREDALRILNMLQQPDLQNHKDFYRGHFSGSPDMLRDW
jgi:Ca-activated chloride channel family protein